MSWFWQNGNELFIFFTFPIIGIGLDLLTSKRIIVYILVVSGILLAPILTGYSYLIDWLYQLFGLVFFSCLYALYSMQIEKRASKIILSVSSAMMLFFLLGFCAFMDSFSGNQRVIDSWKFDNYKVEYIRDQGFAGGPLMKYELSKYAVIPIFVKKIETVTDIDTTRSCRVIFTHKNLVLDKCAKTLTSSP